MKPWLTIAATLLVACGSNGGPDGGGALVCDAGEPQSPPNLLRNAGFECGEQGWHRVSGTTAADPDARTGSQSMKLTASEAGKGELGASGPLASAGAIVDSASGKTYCASAWVKGTVSGVQLMVIAVDKATARGTSFVHYSRVASDRWMRLPPSATLAVAPAAGARLYVHLLMVSGAPNDTLLVDDVDFWESEDGGCQEGR